MEYTVLVKVVSELSRLLACARVERVYQGSEGIVFVLSHTSGRSVLLLSPDRAMPRLHLVSEKPPALEGPHPFVLYLRSHVSGARIVNIDVLNQDRIVELRLRKGKDDYRLVFELFGSSANLFLLDAADTIVSTYFPIHLIDHAERSHCVGTGYCLPKKRTLHGAEAGAIPESEQSVESANKEIELRYRVLSEQRANSTLQHELAACLKKEIARTERLAAALSSDLEKARRIDDYKQAGELILANLGSLKTGMERSMLVGYDGLKIEVVLDPKRSPSRNAELYFKRYKKAKTGLELIVRRLQKTNEETAALRSLLARLVEGRDALENIRKQLVSGGYLKDRRPSVPAVRTAQKPKPYRTVLFQGWEILIGRNAAGNDHLSTRLARPDDLWLHAEGMPGSHVLVRNPGKGEVPSEVLLKAASLAAYHSSGKTATKVSVTYTRAGSVKKPKGAKAGLVTLSERQSVMVRPENDKGMLE